QTGEVTVGDVPDADQGESDGPDGEANGGEAPAAVTLLPRFTAGTPDPAVGMTIPRVSGTTLDGDERTIEPGGTAKVIVFVAHWCGHCQAEVPRLVEHLKTTPMPDDVELVAISTNVDAKAPNYPPSAWLDR